MRCQLWNVYAASLIPYPAQVALPKGQLEHELIKAFRTALGPQHWGPWWIFPGLRFLFRVKGCPRCPLTIARASGVLAWLRVGGIGAAPHRAEHGKVWMKLVTWTSGPGAAAAPEHAQRIRNIQLHLGTATLEFDRRLGAALYEAAWWAYLDSAA